MNRVEIILNDLLQSERQYASDLEKSLKGKENSKLYIRKRAGALFFTEVNEGRETGITKNKEKIVELLVKEQTQKDIDIAKRNSMLLSDCIRRIRTSGNDNIQRQMEVCEYLGFGGTVSDKVSWEWILRNGSSNYFRQEELKYTTSQGLKVRSKSEMNIASRLEIHRIPFIYEKEFYVGGKRLFPDFTIRKRDGNIVIWEHFGLMNDQEYASRAAEKIELYRQAGFVQCHNLICTYEEDISSIWAIDNIIKKFVFF